MRGTKPHDEVHCMPCARTCDIYIIMYARKHTGCMAAAVAADKAGHVQPGMA